MCCVSQGNAHTVKDSLTCSTIDINNIDKDSSNSNESKSESDNFDNSTTNSMSKTTSKHRESFLPRGRRYTDDQLLTALFPDLSRTALESILDHYIRYGNKQEVTPCNLSESCPEKPSSLVSDMIFSIPQRNNMEVSQILGSSDGCRKNHQNIIVHKLEQQMCTSEQQEYLQYRTEAILDISRKTKNTTLNLMSKPNYSLNLERENESKLIEYSIKDKYMISDNDETNNTSGMIQGKSAPLLKTNQLNSDNSSFCSTISLGSFTNSTKSPIKTLLTTQSSSSSMSTINSSPSTIIADTQSPHKLGSSDYILNVDHEPSSTTSLTYSGKKLNSPPILPRQHNHNQRRYDIDSLLFKYKRDISRKSSDRIIISPSNSIN